MLLLAPWVTPEAGIDALERLAYLIAEEMMRELQYTEGGGAWQTQGSCCGRRQLAATSLVRSMACLTESEGFLRRERAAQTCQISKFPGGGHMFMNGHQISLTFLQHFQHGVERCLIACAEPITRNLLMGCTKF